VKPDARTISQRVRQRRRELSMTQAELAEKAACQQSAISMFEKGRTSALAKKTVDAIAEVLDLDISKHALVNEVAAASTLVAKYCPVDDCPTNTPYVVSGALHFAVSLTKAPNDQKTRCSFCGELLQACCPNTECKSSVCEGSCCPECGADYVANCQGLEGSEAVRWADDQRAHIREIWKHNRAGLGDSG